MKEIISRLEVLNGTKLKYDTQENGNHLICYLKDVFLNKFPDKIFLGDYLHCVFRPLNMEEINYLKSEVNKEFSEDYIDLLKISNGLNIFSNMIVLFGLGKVKNGSVYEYSRDQNLKSPFDIVDINLMNKDTEKLFIGKLDEDYIYQHKNNGNRVYIASQTGDFLGEWSNISTFLDEKIQLISPNFDSNGVVKNPKIIGKYIFNKVGGI